MSFDASGETRFRVTRRLRATVEARSVSLPTLLGGSRRDGPNSCVLAWDVGVPCADQSPSAQEAPGFSGELSPSPMVASGMNRRVGSGNSTSPAGSRPKRCANVTSEAIR